MKARKQKSLGQIAYKQTSEPYPWGELTCCARAFYERIARAVEREVLRRLRASLPPSSACMIKRKKK